MPRISKKGSSIALNTLLFLVCGVIGFFFVRAPMGPAMNGDKKADSQASVQSQSAQPSALRKPESRGQGTQAKEASPVLKDWRGAPVGDGEDTVDSYHSVDHRPPGSDPRDWLLKKYTIHPCPDNGVGMMVSGQDPRYFQVPTPANKLFKERNPKFICSIEKITDGPHQPCVIYSFGSCNEISFEVRKYVMSGVSVFCCCWKNEIKYGALTHNLSKTGRYRSSNKITMQSTYF
jgi:hypothetical protein